MSLTGRKGGVKVSRMDFIGKDDKSPEGSCPAVHMDRATGDMFHVGRRVTDPEAIASLAEQVPIHDDEVAMWTPASMNQHYLAALTGEYEPSRVGYEGGQPSLPELIRAAKRSIVHVEGRDTYDPTHPSFLRWQETRDTSYPWDNWVSLIGGVVERGVRVRRLRVVSEPVSDYIRWEHAISYGNIQAGEDLRWLPRRLAYDLLIPVADLWLFDQRSLAFNHTAGDGTAIDHMDFQLDPRYVTQIIGVIEQLWERGIPHAEYKPS